MRNIHTRLDKKSTRVAYEALSYVWGSAELNHEVFVVGRRLRITTNLHVALVQLRSQVSDRIIWIDAVCIDQNNLKERGHQVQQMSKIYREAERVLFWLGPGTEDTKNTLLYLQWLRLKVDQVEARGQSRDILEMGDRNQLEFRRRIASELHDRYDFEPDDSDPKTSACYQLWYEITWVWHSDHWKEFKELLLVPWFKRVWILQEVANASAALVCCGSVSIPADTFCSMLPLVFGKPTTSIGTHIRGIIDMMPSPFKTIRNSVGFYHLLQRFGDSQATDPRNIVYGMRGLSRDSEHPDFPPTDYEITEAQLAIRISQFMFHHDLTHWARLSRMSDQINQLEWLLSVAIVINSDSAFCQNLSQLVPDGIVRLTDESLRIPLETGHWRRIPEIIRLSNGRGRIVRFRSDAVIAAFRKCDLTVSRCLMKVYRASLTDLLYAALQNQTFGPELVSELFDRGRGKEG